VSKPETGFEDPRTVLKRHALRPKRSWGQNFLVSPKAVAIIADACTENNSCDTPVVEIGAGVGTLTSALLHRGRAVTAVERDREMCAILRAELGDTPGFRLLEADAAKVSYAELFKETRGVIVGNLPYQLTGRLIRSVTGAWTRISKAVLMVQAEVAERLTAPAGNPNRGALSVVVRARFDTRIIHRLKPTAFHPPPKVRSAVVRFESKGETIFDGGLNSEAFDTVVNAAFTGRRKTLRNSLIASGLEPAETVERRLAKADIDPRWRPEHLSVDDFARLAAASAANE
jgi:16S rRNA (adenine1518-N6/adenine1519-N6)-dimethyltransferase